ncbi:PEP-CTERM sorting domain-containing protein [Methylomicrobium sp. RS1]|uniref:PEP-CTERM sorting domain-containing protein n=1 Tax=Candidatus Methylomicrobium oryzae TaxID=2802053 RepID=UPI0019216CF0|nr:PEP-CTERM sorting domain-containing protein [Methylomicrobium sp. RS1]MBL1264948.1 PEP-CTERM sorting domain-containing protein [Methylomicrobium sp. RS1]
MKPKFFAILALSTGMVTTANAGVVVLNDWQFDATTVAAEGITAVNGVVTNVDHLVINNVFHTTIDTTGGTTGALDAGDTFNVQANGTVQSFNNAADTVISPILFNSPTSFFTANGWELTFTFNINGVFTTNVDAAGNTNFDHTSGVLNFYLDNIADGTGQAANGAASPNVTDGTLVASFNVASDVGDNNYGGVFNAFLGNGGDRALFSLAANPFGAFKDSLGNALALGTTLAFSNTDFQSNVAGNPPFSYNPAAFQCGLNLTDFCGTESGQLRVGTAAAPEPGSLALLGLGLGLFGFRKRVAYS